jgi:hypothetical protein
MLPCSFAAVPVAPRGCAAVAGSMLAGREQPGESDKFRLNSDKSGTYALVVADGGR